LRYVAKENPRAQLDTQPPAQLEGEVRPETAPDSLLKMDKIIK